MKRGWVLVLTMVGLSCALHAQQAGNDSVRSVATDMREFDVRVTDMVAPTADTAAIVADTRHKTDRKPYGCPTHRKAFGTHSYSPEPDRYTTAVIGNYPLCMAEP